MINHRIIWIILFALIQTFIQGQRYDFNWMTGYGGGSGDPKYGITNIDFNSGNPFLSYVPSRMYLHDANAVYSDVTGKLLYYTNGFEIENSEFKLMSDGDNLGIKYWPALISAQNVLFLPFPDNKDSILLFYPNLRKVETHFYEMDLRYCILNNSLNNGKGKVIERDKIIISDTLNEGGLTSCKHANGRDWWILMNELNSDKFYKILITQKGVNVIDTQLVGQMIVAGVGQSKFSPDGSLYAVFKSISDIEGSYLYLFSFDRCNGMLRYLSKKHIEKLGVGGIEFSPNSRFLYYCCGLQLYQFDLHEALNLENEMEIDTIIDRYLPWGSSYYQQQLAPDGRIYISNPYSSDIMHVINNPDEKGLSCKPTYNSFKLLTINARSISNMPNYRLGPVDGSRCDSLNISNLPFVHWRYEQESINYLNFYFTDLSAYEVMQWCWDFGDTDSGMQNTSMDRNPQHVFSKNGSYEVCLIAKNKNGTDTLCRTVRIGMMTSTESKIQFNSIIDIWPNPCSDYLVVNLNEYNPVKMNLELIDITGNTLITRQLFQGSNTISLTQLPNAVYNLRIFENNELVKVKTILKI
jgi:hypothetical protein